MELKPRNYEKIVQLMHRGVDIPNPLTLDIGDEVNIDRISGKGITLYPGCRIYGAKTVISAGARLGAEAPVTVDDCQLGLKVELKGGYFKKSVFLEKANMSFGAHVREGSILEEEANGAHCVGLKQTILFPFVTLGSLINFCDCLMAGGTSRKDHSEVGSSYIHFNFTPDGNKTTASLFGDVPRGVMLNQPAIFLGGQGGAVGPMRLGYGNVVAAGLVLRDDVPEDRKFIIVKPHPGTQRDFVPHAYKNLTRIVANNIIYLANLAALEQWYIHVRQPFFSTQELGSLVYEGALDTLVLAKKERTSRLTAMVEKTRKTAAAGRKLHESITEVCALFSGEQAAAGRGAFLSAFHDATKGTAADYIQTIQKLPPDVSAKGVQWLQQVINSLCERAGALLKPMNLFHNK